MKKLGIFCLLLCLFFVSGESFANQISDLQYHKHWSSYIAHGNNASVVRLSTKTANTGFTLSIYNNNTYSIFMSGPYAAGYPNMNFPYPVPMEMRVDRNDIYTVMANLSTNNGYLIVNITLPKIDFISQAIRGRFLRFKFTNPVMNDAAYIKFSLLGFTSAFTRAMNLCRHLYKNYTPEEEFFRKTPPKKQPRLESDDAYFL